MFTGLVEEVGDIIDINKGMKSSVLTIGAKTIMSDVKIGDSIAVNGICLTVTQMTSNSFTVDVMSETLSKTSLGMLTKGSKVNLERAMMAGQRFGGHIVSGHIDGTGCIKSIQKDDNAVWYCIEADKLLLKYIVQKGSITIDGISLTVAKVNDKSFSVSIIPHTQKVTTLGLRTLGDIVNLECDMIGKYVEKLMTFGCESIYDSSKENNDSKITMEYLADNGFI